MDKKICRVCGINEGASNIFAQSEGFRVSAKIMYCCTKVTIVEGDGLPARICRSCEGEVDAAYQFVLKCEATDQRLRENAVTKTIDISIPVINDDNKPKIEVKLEENCSSDNDNNYEISSNYAAFEQKQEVKVKQESQRTKKSKRSYKKRIKYAETGPCKCSICGTEIACPSALAVHMRYHTGETPFPCPSCDKKYKDQGSLKRHIQRNHFEGERERNFICENCGKGFFSKNDVKIHMRTHTGETPYACTECPRKFTQPGALLRHKKRHSGDKPHKCATCDKHFCTKDELKYHLQVHTDEKKYSCSICNVPFKYRNNLKKHMVLHSAPRSFSCIYCGRTFNQKGNLKGHIDRQHSEKSGFCNICSKNVSDVEVHMWRHTGQRPLKCEHCTSSFFELKTLARHINYRHKNPDKFECSFEGCDMKFPARTMLEFHTAKLHKTGIPFPCDRCTRGFYRKNDLARHKIGTHKEKLIN